MCGPVHQCCVCLPVRGGVAAIGVIMAAAETGLGAYNVWLMRANNAEYKALVGDDQTAHDVATAGVIVTYSLAVFMDLLLVVGAIKKNR